MKLGISYNLFDGEELLEGSIKSIRNSVDYISVVYQLKSNTGQSCSEDLENMLQKLKSSKLIDEIFLYNPTMSQPYLNETNKRQIGYELSKRANCTHHMSMDTDEYYLENELNSVKKLIEDNDYDSSYCQMQTYYKSWEYKLDPPEEYYVPLIYKIKENSSFNPGQRSPVLVDRTRKLSNLTNPIVLKREQIQMHHGSYIRNDIRKKLINSSAVVNFHDQIDILVDHYNKWEYPQQVLWGGRPCTLLNVIKTDKLF